MFFNNDAVNFPLISSRGNPSVPPDGTELSAFRIVLFDATAGP